MNAVVLGAAGFVGGELLRLLTVHPNITHWSATSRSQAGQRVADLHPALAGFTDATFEDLSPVEAAKKNDVVFLCFEHGESAKVAKDVLDSNVKLVIDLAADFRIRDASLHDRYYGARPSSETADRFVYGLADVLGTSLVGKKAIASPGCFATAAQLALYPLRELSFAGPPSLVGITGSSGAGALAKPTTHHPVRAHNLFAYSLFGHRHEGEILEQWRKWTGKQDAIARLLTHSGPFVRGIHLTLHASLAEGRQLKKGEAANLYRDAFAGKPFVRVVDAPPQLTHVVGSNDAIVHVAQDPEGREIAATIVIDNLVKGAGGQAIQAMNLALGLPETTGLKTPVIFPN